MGISINQSNLSSEWLNPNENIWKIIPYSGGIAVNISPDNPSIWFKINETPFSGEQFRGAIIDYHAYLSGNENGTIIGTIYLAYDFGNDPTHFEHLSGSNLDNTSLWDYMNVESDYGLAFSSVNNLSTTNLMIQWSAKIFYGSEYYC